MSNNKSPTPGARFSGTHTLRTSDRELHEYIASRPNKTAWLRAVAYLGMITERNSNVSMIDKANAVAAQVNAQ